MDFINQKEKHYGSLEYGDTTPCKYSMCDIDTSELEHIMRSQSRKLQKLQLENNQYHNKYIQEIYTKRKMKIDKIKEDTKEWIFITINPKPEIKLDDFINKITSLTKWKIFQKGYFVLEQRGENDATKGNGFHAHIMLEKYTIERKRLITRLEQTFQKYVEKHPKDGYKNVINVKRKIPEHAKETLEEYMKGKKQEDKTTKCDLDIKWREENNIDDIYVWDTTTDKSIPKKGADGRVSNGGKRTGAGRPKKEIVEDKLENKIEWGKKVTLEF